MAEWYMTNIRYLDQVPGDEAKNKIAEELQAEDYDFPTKILDGGVTENWRNPMIGPEFVIKVLARHGYLADIMQTHEQNHYDYYGQTEGDWVKAQDVLNSPDYYQWYMQSGSFHWYMKKKFFKHNDDTVAKIMLRDVNPYMSPGELEFPHDFLVHEHEGVWYYKGKGYLHAITTNAESTPLPINKLISVLPDNWF